MEFSVVKQKAEFMDRRFLANYITENGHNELSSRAESIIAAIEADLVKGIPYSRLKYKTLCKHIDKMLTAGV